MGVYGVSFEKVGRIHKFSYDKELLKGERIIAESEFGIEVGEVVKVFNDTEETEKAIIKKATNEDIQNYEQNEKDAQTALVISKEKVLEHSLPMKMLRARYTLDRSKLIFFFSADGRVDFRALVKDLAMTFKTRIELRQIGIRDAAKLVGGIGMCGMQTCCSRFERDFKSITLKYAKVQQLMINPAKISGACGRLLCCLAYENDTYLEILKNIPDAGQRMRYKNIDYIVSEINIFHKIVKLQATNGKSIILSFDEILKSRENQECDLNS